MSTAVWGNGEAYSLAHAELRGVATVYDPSGALFLPDLHMLVVSDLHLEKGSSFARRGQLIPPYDTAATLDMLAAVIARYQPRTVVSLGDSFHDAKASDRLPSLYKIRLTSLMEQRDWFWITGNHDPDRPGDLPGECIAQLAIGPLTFRHIPSRDQSQGEVAGHLHPAARIVRKGRSVRRPCFASDGDRLIMPAFGAYTGALNVLDRAFRGLFVDARMRAYMLGQGKVYPIAHGTLVAG
ncbi:ligase-associated DNA damage response endonuclease PdeM [Brucella sp. NBRC 12950]|uniref:ligase-associated DNA damage response endonuclease PdeM n=1 Tax=Brucella sp. NBRC 12950 TaxID=2994518 RepID=UPI0024A3F49E|nr:ligase-associated DNA damage response endonuclease PdeM [Brucella sp. NBRC 12950]GLU25554.1 metallophosphatase [Brucella sp. NBRC 12950]